MLLRLVFIYPLFARTVLILQLARKLTLFLSAEAGVRAVTHAPVLKKVAARAFALHQVLRLALVYLLPPHVIQKCQRKLRQGLPTTRPWHHNLLVQRLRGPVGAASPLLPAII